MSANNHEDFFTQNRTTKVKSINLYRSESIVSQS